MTDKEKNYHAERQRIKDKYDELIKIAGVKFEVTEEAGYWLQMLQYGAQKLEALEELNSAYMLGAQ